MIGIILAAGILTYPAFASDAGLTCLDKCYAKSGSSGARVDTKPVLVGGALKSHPKRTALLANGDCKALMAYVECLRACPSTALDAVVEQYTMLVEYNCSPAYDSRVQEEFWRDYNSLVKAELKHFWRNCLLPKDDSTNAGSRVCKTYKHCLNEHVRHAVDKNFTVDAVTAFVDLSKIGTVLLLEERTHHALAHESCNVLFQPHQV
ncbi:hypothetical protein AAVH_26948 [Aphelenchoides avenae]|nr:hypothetical protein AAVH_26948 [Aphelenchus avenae]